MDGENILTIDQLVSVFPAFGEKTVRWWIYNGKNNGFDGCLIRIGLYGWIPKKLAHGSPRLISADARSRPPGGNIKQRRAKRVHCFKRLSMKKKCNYSCAMRKPRRRGGRDRHRMAKARLRGLGRLAKRAE